MIKIQNINLKLASTVTSLSLILKSTSEDATLLAHLYLLVRSVLYLSAIT